MTRTPTGYVRNGNQLALDRSFNAPIDDVWAAVTESDRLGRWFGTWTGDPSSGQVVVTMVAEDGHEGSQVEILRCEPPRLLDLHLTEGPLDWLLTLELTETEGVTTLTLVQTFTAPDEIGSVGPGWEYYLDRLVAAEENADVDAISFDAYFPSQQPHYESLTTQMQFP